MQAWLFLNITHFEDTHNECQISFKHVNFSNEKIALLCISCNKYDELNPEVYFSSYVFYHNKYVCVFGWNTYNMVN